jgi:predicted RNase H-like nuclease (RuvC/YqgF family)
VLPAKEVSIEDLSKELMQAIENNNVIKEIKQNIEEYQEEIRDIEKKIEELNDRKSKLQSLISKEKEIYDRSKIIDTDNIQAKISDAENLNNQIRQAERYFNKKKEVEKLDGSYRDKTSELEKIQSEKQSLILNAKMPIDNLGVDDDGVTYNNIPFSQLSSAEQLKVSLSIAMAMNPKLRVIRITDGSLLDSTNMEIIRQMANENDFQVWIERVDDTGKIGIYIEDGEIKESA